MADIFLRDATLYGFDQIYPLMVQLRKEATQSKEQILPVHREVTASDSEFARRAVLDGEIVGFIAGLMINGFWHGKSRLITAVAAGDDKRRITMENLLPNFAKGFAIAQGSPAIEPDSAFHRAPAHACYEKYGFEKFCYTFGLLLQ